MKIHSDTNYGALATGAAVILALASVRVVLRHH